MEINKCMWDEKSDLETIDFVTSCLNTNVEKWARAASSVSLSICMNASQFPANINKVYLISASVDHNQIHLRTL